jgi:DNA-binding NarL/FixJ family response regulator
VIRILLADDHRIFREGIRRLIEDLGDLEVVAEAGSCGEAIARLAEANPDLAILDLSMPGRDDLDLVGEVHRLRPRLPILVLTMYGEPSYAGQALGAGARGYITKDCAALELIDAIRCLLAGGKYISGNVAERLALSYTRHPEQVTNTHLRLSERETRVFELLAEGRTVTEIAAMLELNTRTISTYKQRLLQKMKLRHQTDLVRYAIEHKLLK